MGILIYNLKALDFFVSTEPGDNEKIENFNELRFIEHNKPIHMICVESESLSVDTPMDLERVRTIMAQRLEKRKHDGQD